MKNYIGKAEMTIEKYIPASKFDREQISRCIELKYRDISFEFKLLGNVVGSH